MTFAYFFIRSPSPFILKLNQSSPFSSKETSTSPECPWLRTSMPFPVWNEKLTSSKPSPASRSGKSNRLTYSLRIGSGLSRKSMRKYRESCSWLENIAIMSVPGIDASTGSMIRNNPSCQEKVSSCFCQLSFGRKAQPVSKTAIAAIAAIRLMITPGLWLCSAVYG